MPEKGFDIVNEDLQIYAEMKNKHNTMNSSSSAKLYMKMQNLLLKQPSATCILVEVIAKNSQDIIWKCKIDDESVSHKNIRRVSIDKFYELVTGDKEAFAKLCQVLPRVIQDILHNEQQKIIENTVIDEIKGQNIEHILTSIYLLAFKKYQGFEHFRLDLA